MKDVVIGLLTMGFAVAGVLFLRFWRETHDRLFLYFALAMFVLAIDRLGFAFVPSRDAQGHYLDWLRLAAFALIAVGVVDKNTGRPR